MRHTFDDEFKNRLARLIEKHPTHGRKSLGLALGRSNGFISSLLNGGSSPSVSVVAGLCKELKVTPNYLLGYSDEISLSTESTTEFERQAEALLDRMMMSVTRKMELSRNKLTTDDLLAWYRQNNGRLNSWDGFQSEVDLFKVPEKAAEIIEPVSLGANSLASRTLQTSDPGRMYQFFDSLTGEMRQDIVFSYANAANEEKLSFHKIVVDLADMEAPLHLQYSRVLLPVQDALGHSYILNFSRLLDT